MRGARFGRREGRGGYCVGLGRGRRALVSDVDGTLLDGGRPCDDAAALGSALVAADAALVLCSGRGLRLSLVAADALAAAGLPWPSALVCGVGSEVHAWDGTGFVRDEAWRERLAASGFSADDVREALSGVRGLRLQPADAQGEHKVSYLVEDGAAVEEAARALAARGSPARLVHSAGRYLDVLPRPASKGGALLWLVERYGLEPEDVVAAGDSGNDRELLVAAADAGMVAVLVANHEPELSDLRSYPGVLAAARPFCAGVAEGLARAGWQVRAGR
ncbi:MAG TPA: HAD-IIB family hydrolase [Trueperaceae bacterium]